MKALKTIRGVNVIVSCDCGGFKARLTSFPKDTPGRLMCYCKDCQNFMKKINRMDVLDNYGGTEIIPVYPGDVDILEGHDKLKCNRLSERGILRWTACCCNSPIANTRIGFPWAGFFHTTFSSEDPAALDNLGNVKCRIFGRDALEGSPNPISDKIGVKDTLVVMPFIIKGKFLKKHRHSPFFKDDDLTPVVEPELLAG